MSYVTRISWDTSAQVQKADSSRHNMVDADLHVEWVIFHAWGSFPRENGKWLTPHADRRRRYCVSSYGPCAPVWMSHVSHVGMSHVSHVWMSHVSHMWLSCITHLWMIHVTHRCRRPMTRDAISSTPISSSRWHVSFPYVTHALLRRVSLPTTLAQTQLRYKMWGLFWKRALCRALLNSKLFWFVRLFFLVIFFKSIWAIACVNSQLYGDPLYKAYLTFFTTHTAPTQNVRFLSEKSPIFTGRLAKNTSHFLLHLLPLLLLPHTRQAVE